MTAGITRTVSDQSAGSEPISFLKNIGNALGLSIPQSGGKRRRNKSMKAGQKSKKATGKKSKKAGKKSKKAGKKSKKASGKKSRKSRK